MTGQKSLQGLIDGWTSHTDKDTKPAHIILNPLTSELAKQKAA